VFNTDSHRPMAVPVDGLDHENDGQNPDEENRDDGADDFRAVKAIG